MRKTLFVLALVPVMAAAAVEDSEIATCAARASSVERLACFDNLAKRHQLAPSSITQPSEGPGKWWTNTTVDPLNDEDMYLAGLTAESGRGRFGEDVDLVIRCKNNKTEMYINWQSFLGMDGIRTTYRVGKSPAATSTWGVSTDHTSAFFPGSPVPTLKQMHGETSFIANVTPYSESPVTATFDLTGIETALADIRSGCNW